MKILVINAGSSSLKYQLIDMTDEQVLAKGNCERIGIDGKITHTLDTGKKISYEVAFPTHTEAFKELVKLLTEGEDKVISSVSEISAVGQRVVHGGEQFSKSVRITDEVLQTIEELSDLAPLHNPAAVLAIRAAREVFGEQVPQVAVFDTAFHHTMPEKAYMFGIPYEYYEKYHVRRYGFHGTSHRYVSNRLFEISEDISRNGSRIITCHLGNGSSLCAIKNGVSVDTSMGFTPLDGFIMGTRAGALDASVVTYLAEKEGLNSREMSDLLNKKSGLLGLSGISSDNRDVNRAADAGDPRAQLTVDMLSYQIKKFVGSYAAAMGGLDAVIFTGGIGENDHHVRKRVCAGMDFLGISIDEILNREMQHGAEGKISFPHSRVEVWVIPTNEELLIARDAALLAK
ncbi:MAG: acetate kinase [Anaerotruncus sp.]|nr:acetate kinase [Anaerotruncus sp.]